MKIEFSLLVLVALLLGGCQRAAETESGDNDVVVMDGPPPESLDGADGHPEHGPHGGELIELGQETYHGELVHDDKQVTIYVLDGAATKSAPIQAKSVTLGLKHEGTVQSFELSASPDEQDADGFSSRYTSSDSKLCEWMAQDAEGSLMMEIDGKSYTGQIEHHDHDHAH